MTGWAFVSDFDGTITTFDVGDAVCLHFGAATKEEIRRSWQGGVSVPRWMRKMFGRLSVERQEIEAFVLSKVEPRPGFAELAAFCKNRKLPCEIASGGVDLYISPLLKNWGLGHIETRCAKAAFDGKGWRLDYSELKGRKLEILKASRVLAHKRRGRKVVFCGDAPNDFLAAKAADIAFARGPLLQLCRERGVSARTLTDFRKPLKLLSDGAACSLI